MSNVSDMRYSNQQTTKSRGRLPRAITNILLNSVEDLTGKRVVICDMVVVVLEAEYTGQVICQETGKLMFNHVITKVH